MPQYSQEALDARRALYNNDEFLSAPRDQQQQMLQEWASHYAPKPALTVQLKPTAPLSSTLTVNGKPVPLPQATIPRPLSARQDTVRNNISTDLKPVQGPPLVVQGPAASAPLSPTMNAIGVGLEGSMLNSINRLAGNGNVLPDGLRAPQGVGEETIARLAQMGTDTVPFLAAGAPGWAMMGVPSMLRNAADMKDGLPFNQALLNVGTDVLSGKAMDVAGALIPGTSISQFGARNLLRNEASNAVQYAGTGATPTPQGDLANLFLGAGMDVAGGKAPKLADFGINPERINLNNLFPGGNRSATQAGVIDFGTRPGKQQPEPIDPNNPYTPAHPDVIAQHKSEVLDARNNLEAAYQSLEAAAEGGADSNGRYKSPEARKQIRSAPNEQLRELMQQMSPSDQNNAFRDAANGVIKAREELQTARDPMRRDAIAAEWNHAFQNDIPEWTDHPTQATHGDGGNQPPEAPIAAAAENPQDKASEFINLQRAAKTDPVRDTIAEAVNRTAESEGWNKDDWRRTQQQVQTEADSITPEQIQHVIDNPPKNGETISDAMMKRLSDELNGAATQRQRIAEALHKGQNELTEADKTSLQQQAEALDRRMDSFIKITSPQRTQRAQSLAFLAAQAKAGFSHDYWMNQAHRISGGDLPEDVKSELREILTRGRSAQEAVNQEAANGVPQAPDDVLPTPEPQHQRSLWQDFTSFVRNLFGKESDLSQRKGQRHNQRGVLDFGRIESMREQAAKNGDVDPAEITTFLQDTRQALSDRAKSQTGADQQKTLTRIKAIDEKIGRLQNQMQATLTGVVPASKATPPMTAAQKQLQQARMDLTKFFAKLQKTPPLEVASTLVKAGLVSGVRTIEGITGGQAGHLVMQEMHRTFGSMADAVGSLVTGNDRQIVALNPKEMLNAIKTGAKKGAQEAGQILKRGATDEELAAFQLPHEMNSGSKILDAANYVFRTHSAIYSIARNIAMQASLREQAKLMAINEARSGTIQRSEIKQRTEHWMQNPTDAMQVAAVDAGARAIMTQDNHLSSGWNSMKSSFKRSGAPGEVTNFALDTIVAPFTKVPTNMAISVAEHSLVGLGAEGAVGIYNRIKQGRLLSKLNPQEQRAVSLAFGKGMVGMGLMTLGYSLAKQGLMSGANPDDPNERNRNEMTGKIPNAVRVGNTWRSVSRFGPMGPVMSIGATLAMMDGTKEHKAITAPAVVGREILDVPMLHGLASAIAALSNPDKEGASFATNLGREMIPTPIGDLASAFDPSQRKPEGFLQAMQSRIPGLRNSLPEKVDAFGQGVPQNRMIGVDPFLSSSDRTENDPIVAEMDRLKVPVSKGPKSLEAYNEDNTKRKVDLSPEQHNLMQAARGAIAREYLSELMRDPDYAPLSDAEKANAIKHLLLQSESDATAMMKEKVLQPQ